MIDVVKRQELITAMRTVIEKENLPRPERISIRSPPKGIRRTKGRCIKSREGTRYRITVSTTRAKFIPDPNGSYVNRLTKERMRLSNAAEHIPLPEIVHTAAHEIAHLKFWSHDTQHEGYTQHILKLLNEELRWFV